MCFFIFFYLDNCFLAPVPCPNFLAPVLRLLAAVDQCRHKLSLNVPVVDLRWEEGTETICYLIKFPLQVVEELDQVEGEEFLEYETKVRRPLCAEYFLEASTRCWPALDELHQLSEPLDHQEPHTCVLLPSVTSSIGLFGSTRDRGKTFIRYFK